MNQGSEFQYRIDGRPDFSFLHVEVPAGRMLKVEASSMAAMSPNMKMKTKMRGGMSRFLTGESIFINEFTADDGAGEIQIAPGSPGDMEHVALDNETIYLQGSAYVASSPGINVESKWQGLKKGFFSGDGLFLIRCSGRGDLWFNTYGAMIRFDVKKDFVVDTNYIVAFTEGLSYDIRSVGGYKSLFFSGEGLVCRFTGEGTLWVQTRQIPAFATWVGPFRPKKKKNKD